MIRSCALIFLVIVSTACAVRDVYVKAGYNPKDPNAVKRIRVVTRGGTESIGEILTHVTTDLIRLRKNYIVHDPKETDSIETVCQELEGALVIEPLSVSTREGAVSLDIKAELYSCGDEAVLWRAEGDQGMAAKDEDLENLRKVYEQKLGEDAGRFAAPAFSLIKQLIETLPDPDLNDEEVMEKIEMGATRTPHSGSPA